MGLALVKIVVEANASATTVIAPALDRNRNECMHFLIKSNKDL